MRKLLTLTLSCFVFASCEQQEFTNHELNSDIQLTDNELISVHNHIIEGLNNIDTERVNFITEEYASLDDFLNNADESELSMLKFENTLDIGLENKLKGLTIESTQLITERLESILQIHKSYKNANTCADRCMFGSHEVWFDVYMSTGSYDMADIAASYFWLGCFTSACIE